VCRHVARTKEHRNLAQRNAARLVQLENAIHHECSLALLILRGNEPRALPVRSRGPECLRVALGCATDEGVAGVQNLLAGTVVLLESDDARSGKLLWEIEDVAHLRTAEAVDALCVVAHHGNVAVLPAHSAKDA